MKKQLSSLVLLVAMAFLATACHRNDIRTETFQIEQLRSEEAVPLLSNALTMLPGIQGVTASIEKHTLTVKFDGLALYLKNIEYAIVNAGFSLPNWPATEQQKAKLPQELR
jgi:copper chaperone CopZ